MKKIYNVKIELDLDKINYAPSKEGDFFKSKLWYALEFLLPTYFKILQIKEEK